MKNFVAYFWRGNPQLASGGYESKVEIRAKSKETAMKQVRKYEKKCVYGTMTFLRMEEVEK